MIDRPVMVLTRFAPKVGRLPDAKKMYDEWVAFLATIPECNGVSLICCIDDQIAWTEQWANKAVFDEFNKVHLAFSGFMANMFDCSRDVPGREVYRKLL